jgi:hypothetical protein
VVVADTGHIARESNVREEATALKRWHICRHFKGPPSREE